MSPSEEQDPTVDKSTAAMDDATELTESTMKAQTAADDGTSGMVLSVPFVEEDDPYKYQ